MEILDQDKDRAVCPGVKWDEDKIDLELMCIKGSYGGYGAELKGSCESYAASLCDLLFVPDCSHPFVSGASIRIGS